MTFNKVLVTGSTGFIGRNLSKSLFLQGFKVKCAARTGSLAQYPGEVFYTDTLSGGTDWAEGLKNIDVVIHLAATAHIRGNTQLGLVDIYKETNVDATLNLAEQAAKAGVRRFIFMSSIGVNGSEHSDPYQESDVPAPVEPYACSKLEAERALLNLTCRTDMDIVIIRPPLVYGKNAPGNFGSLARWVSRGVPLPLGAINNKRTFVGIDNLISLITVCIDHPKAANQVFLAGDAESVSTSEFLRRVAAAMNKKARLIPVPESWLILIATILRKLGLIKRLLGSLQVDISKAHDVLGWVPPLSLSEGLRRCFEEPT